jgi:Spy/CpxP family protein refolding chaperone
MLAGLLTVTAGATGFAVAGWAQSGHGMHGKHGHAATAAMDPAAMDAHFDAMIASFLPDGTAQQKARLKTIAAAVHADIGAVHRQLPQAHQRAHDLLLQPTIDRAALEALRADEMHQLDVASKRIVGEIVDAAEVLTPAQRARIATHLKASGHQGAKR